MLFQPEHIPMILDGTKTATRRNWKKVMVKVGGVYKVKTKMMSKEYACLIRVVNLYKQALGDMTIDDCQNEGYNTLDEFRDIWIKINGVFIPELVVTVVDFRLDDGKSALTKWFGVIKKM